MGARGEIKKIEERMISLSDFPTLGEITEVVSSIEETVSAINLLEKVMARFDSNDAVVVKRVIDSLLPENKEKIISSLGIICSYKEGRCKCE